MLGRSETFCPPQWKKAENKNGCFGQLLILEILHSVSSITDMQPDVAHFIFSLISFFFLTRLHLNLFLHAIGCMVKIKSHGFSAGHHIVTGH